MFYVDMKVYPCMSLSDQRLLLILPVPAAAFQANIEYYHIDFATVVSSRTKPVMNSELIKYVKAFDITELSPI